MSNFESLGKALVLLGLVILLVGLFVMFGDKIPYLKNLGRLPGDLAIKRDNFQFYFPLTTSILLSLILTFLFWLFRR